MVNTETPWIERRKVTEAINVLENGEQNWEDLGNEEKYDTVVEALEILEENE